ncbi:glycosyltransferase family 2 protein [Bifidobacterium apri]|uniref:glycosyltransferase family 2 protein n=1 Tax=Bifidobacterium apri TaxID=1769423 RepID=UPI003990E2D4
MQQQNTEHAAISHESGSPAGTFNAQGQPLNVVDGITRLLDALQEQHRAPDDGTGEKVARHRWDELLTIPREEFNHGVTRDRALRHTHGDFILFLTQDAMPEDDHFESMLHAFNDSAVAMVSRRQITCDDTRPFERLVGECNYPAESSTRSREDIPQMGGNAYESWV